MRTILAQVRFSDQKNMNNLIRFECYLTNIFQNQMEYSYVTGHYSAKHCVICWQILKVFGKASR